MIEKLTVTEHRYLEGFGTPESNKALRIIDAQAAALEAAKLDAEEWHIAAAAEGKAKLRAEASLRAQEHATQSLSLEVSRQAEALVAADAREKSLQDSLIAALRIIDAQAGDLAAALVAKDAEIERLRAGHEQTLNERDAAHNAMAEWERLRNEAYALYRAEGDKRAAAEARGAEAQAEIERLEGMFQQTHGVHHSWVARAKQCDAAEARLAEATALLEKVPGLCGIGVVAWQYRLRAFLANQPAAPARTEDKPVDAFGGCGVATCALCYQARTEADQAVLDAMDAVALSALRRHIDGSTEMGAPCRAELARRGLK